MAHPTTDETEGKKKQEPVHKLTAWTGSRIEVAVWKHENGDIVNYSVSCGRSYKDGEVWKNSDFFHERDMLTLAFLLQQAFAWINEQGR